MASGFFQFLRPDDIVFLIKPSLQLHQRSDLFSILRCLCQRCDDWRIAAYPVKCLLDGQNLRIPCGRFDKINHRLETHVRMVQENILLPYIGKDVIIILQSRHFRGLVSGYFKILKPRKPVNLHQEGKIHGTRNIENIILPDLQLFLQDIQKLRGDSVLHLQADNLPPLSFLQLLFDLHQKIGSLVLINSQLRVPHNAVGIGTYHLIPQEELLHVSLDDLLQENQRFLSALFRKLDKAGKDGGHLYSGKHPFSPVCLSHLLDQRADIQGFIPDQRERP